MVLPSCGEELSPVIEPVKAPFEIRQFSRNVFPDYTKKVRKSKNAGRAIQAAIDKVAAKGGGHVVIPEGVWQTGRLILRSNVDLHLEEGAELHFSGEVKDYLPVVLTRNEGIDLYSLGAMIYANGEENIAVTGKGKLVAPSRQCELSRRQYHSVVEGIEDKPLEERIFDGSNGEDIYMPEFFGPINCKNVLVEGVTFEKSIFWNICPTYCEGIIIRGVTVSSAGIGRTDGIDIDSSRDALIEYTTLDCGDDCFTLKSGRGKDGFRKARPTENVVIRHCKVIGGAGGITIGSETAAMVRNVYAYDCEMENPSRAFYIKTRRPRGGGGENCWFEDIRIKSVKSCVFGFDMLGSSKYVGDLAKRYPPQPVTEMTPVFRNMHFKNITVDSCEQLVTAIGLPESPITNVTLDNITSPCHKMKLQDVDMETCRF